jgi:hypothetical protein
MTRMLAIDAAAAAAFRGAAIRGLLLLLSRL